MASKLKSRKKGNKICAAGIAWAKRTFDRYPSAYANGWLVKTYKARGGKYRMGVAKRKRK